MVEYCEICGEELDPDEDEDGICRKCKDAQKADGSKEHEEYIDPGIT